MGHAGLPGVGVGQAGEAEVAAEGGDDVGEQELLEIAVQIGIVQALVEVG